jgi:hypothetical protein
MAEQLALHLSIDQAGAYLVVVHGLDHQRIALRPVIAALGDEPDAHGIAAGHQPEAVVLDLVNPIGAGRGLVGRRWEAGFDAARPVSGQALTHTLNQHAANLGGSGGRSKGSQCLFVELDRVAINREINVGNRGILALYEIRLIGQADFGGARGGNC